MSTGKREGAIGFRVGFGNYLNFSRQFKRIKGFCPRTLQWRFLPQPPSGSRLVLDVHVISQTELAPQYLKEMREGWSQSLDKFEEYIERNG